MNKIKVFILILVWPAILLGEDNNNRLLSFELDFGIGSYAMKDLKELNDNISSELVFKTQTVQNFPIHYRGGLKVLFNINSMAIGPTFSYQSTGSRVSAKDYSAEYKFDQVVSGFMPGLGFTTGLHQTSLGLLNLNMNLSAIRSTLKMSEQMNFTDGGEQSDNLKLNAWGVGLEPGLSYFFLIKSKIGIGVSLSGMVQLYSQAFYKNDKNNQLINPVTNEGVKPNWSGVRLGLVIHI